MQHNRITKARELVLTGDLEGVDFRAAKSEAEKQILVLEAKLEALKNAVYIDYGAVEVLLNDAISSLTRLDLIICKSNT